MAIVNRKVHVCVWEATFLDCMAVLVLRRVEDHGFFFSIHGCYSYDNIGCPRLMFLEG
jgi:hypothetical protein